MRKKIESKTRESAYTIMLLLLSIFTAIGQTGLEGKVVEVSFRADVIQYSTVAVYSGEEFISGTETDMNGKFYICNLEPGFYSIRISSIGFVSMEIMDVIVHQGRITKMDFAMSIGLLSCSPTIIPYEIPLIDVFNTSSGKTFTSRDIRRMVR